MDTGRWADCDELTDILLQQQAANTFSSFTSAKQEAQSFTLELGKVRAFGENDLANFQGIDNALRSLIAGNDLPSSPFMPVDLFVVQHSIERTSEDWEFFVADDAPNFSEFASGTLITQDGDERYIVGEEPEYIVFPNRHVPVGQRAGLMLRKLS